MFILHADRLVSAILLTSLLNYRLRWMGDLVVVLSDSPAG